MSGGTARIMKSARPNVTHDRFAAGDCGLYNRRMLDIRLIREKPDFVRKRLATRGGDEVAKIDELLKVDSERRKVETELQGLQSERNRLSKEIGAKKSKKGQLTRLRR